MPTDTYYHRKGPIIRIIAAMAVLLVLLTLAVAYGEGFDHDSNDPLWASISGVLLFACIAGLGWMLWRNPRALVISEAGIDIPMTFRRPLHWDEIHRIRRVRLRGAPHGPRDWLIVEPSPGVLAPQRLPTWRKLELSLQKHHGVRIALHGLEADAEDIVSSVERFRPVSDR